MMKKSKSVMTHLNIPRIKRRYIIYHKKALHYISQRIKYDLYPRSLCIKNYEIRHYNCDLNDNNFMDTLNDAFPQFIITRYFGEIYTYIIIDIKEKK